MRKSTAQSNPTTWSMNNSMLQTVKMQGKAKPFGAQFVTRLEGVNGKLVCALSLIATCDDDHCGGLCG